MQWQAGEAGVFSVDQDEVNRQHRQPTTSTDIIFTCMRHCNARGCECGRYETLVQCCSNAGPPSSMGASVRLLLTACADPIYVYSP